MVWWGMFVHGWGTSVPETQYTQPECWAALRGAAPFLRLAPASRELLEKVFSGENGVAKRHLALAPLSEAFDLTPDASNARFRRHAPGLAARAGAAALECAGIGPQEIDALLVTTCTGYLCPGLTSYVAEQLALPAKVLCLDLVGQGCGAAVPNLRTAEALLASRTCGRVLSVCVEICSAAFYLDDDPGVLVSTCLFGDGAAALVLGPQPAGPNRRVEWQAGLSLLDPAKRECLRFELRGGMLRNVLRREVPVLAAKYAEQLLEHALKQTGLERAAITNWIMHAGGREVMLALRRRLGLSEADLQWTSAVLRAYGNLSSASVLFALATALESNAPGGYWWLCSFGAGFSCHGGLLKVE